MKRILGRAKSIEIRKDLLSGNVLPTKSLGANDTKNSQRVWNWEGKMILGFLASTPPLHLSPLAARQALDMWKLRAQQLPLELLDTCPAPGMNTLCLRQKRGGLTPGDHHLSVLGKMGYWLIIGAGI